MTSISLHTGRGRQWTEENMRFQHLPPSGPVMRVAFDTAALVQQQGQNGSSTFMPKAGFPLFAALLRINSFMKGRQLKKPDGSIIHTVMSEEDRAVVELTLIDRADYHGAVENGLSETFRNKYRSSTPCGAYKYDPSYLRQPISLLSELAPDLFVSGDALLVAGAVTARIPTVFIPTAALSTPFDRLEFGACVLMFDFDGVIAGMQNEERTQNLGLGIATTTEEEHRATPHKLGVLGGFFQKCGAIRFAFPEGKNDGMALGVATARGRQSTPRAQTTLRQLGVPLDFEMYASGKPKVPGLVSVGTTIFFDDSAANVQAAHSAKIPAAQVVTKENIEGFLQVHGINLGDLRSAGISLSMS